MTLCDEEKTSARIMLHNKNIESLFLLLEYYYLTTRFLLSICAQSESDIILINMIMPVIDLGEKKKLIPIYALVWNIFMDKMINNILRVLSFSTFFIAVRAHCNWYCFGFVRPTVSIQNDRLGHSRSIISTSFLCTTCE